MTTPSRKSDILERVPAGMMTVRAASKLLEKSAYQIMKLIGQGEIEGESVHNAAGGKNLQVKGESVRAYLMRQTAVTH